MPLPLFFLGNLFFGLASTQAVRYRKERLIHPPDSLPCYCRRSSLPMFTVLRRFSIWMTMIGEQVILR